MAVKRMFSLNVVDTDTFLDMPISTRLLYYELGMRADDDGFVGNYKKIMLFSGWNEDDLKVLFAKKFIIPFDSGVIVIRHWRMNNYLQKDRTKPTVYQEELARLSIDDQGIYQENNQKISTDSSDVYKMYTQNRIEENRLDKNSIYIDASNEASNIPKIKKSKFGEYRNVLLTEKEYQKLKDKFNDLDSKIKNLDEYIEITGKKYKNHYLVILKWADENKNQKNKKIKITMEEYIGSNDFDFNSLNK